MRQYFPILDWTNEDVAEFVKIRGLKLHPHYYDEQGNFCVNRRVGCIGCPMSSGNGVEDFRKFPTILRARVRAYCRYYENHPGIKAREYFAGPYTAVYFNLFCKNLEDLRERTSGMFGSLSDAEVRKWLEDYFKISLRE